ncbi:carboxypeptidase-like regulatory domain-containing protein [Hyalangium gracile]|uniref:carboxypeptidase-like regulatory domain-containing protein n=1 Tax=Hyalangium gracile TaxID=394092 RepID=UPI001CCD0D45|nr:carboxypeptidase-like regulatory domain-containing protein [Hyalangium gracile]
MRSALCLLVPVLALASAGCGGFFNAPLGSAVIRGRVVGAQPSAARVTLRIEHGSEGREDGDDDEEDDDGHGSGDGDEDSFRTGVDADGRFELRDVPASPGALFIIASATHATTVRVDPAGGEVLELGDIVPHPGAFLLVTVVDGAGQPVPHAELDLDGTDVEHIPVNAQGLARLGPLPASCYRVRARADGHDEARADRCPRAGEELSLTLVMDEDEP